MRAVLLVLILAVVAVIALVATGLVDLGLVRGAKAPDVDVSRDGVTATGGQAPSFDIETGSVGVGTRDAVIKVPQIQVNPPANQAAPQNPAAASQPVQNQTAPANAL